MRALKLSEGKLSFHKDYASPQPKPDWVCVRVIQAGICETDLQLVAGYMSFRGVLGHEFVGIAESGSLTGQRVVGEINCSCHDCDMCQRGLGNHCLDRTVLGILNQDGAFAEQVLVPAENLHAIPDSMSDDMATLVEPVAAALQIVDQVPITDRTKCTVVGDGRLGHLSAQVLQSAGANVVVVGKHPEKLARFTRLGIATCRLDETLPVGAEVVVDCTGSTSGLETALRLVRPRGTVVMKTTVAEPHKASLASIVIDEIQLVGSRCGPFDKAIRALDSGQLQLDDFVSAHYRLEEFQNAFEHAARSDTLKVILEI